MDRYSARINLHGTTQREREVARLKNDIINNADSNLSSKDVLLNGEKTKLIINSGTEPYYKTFTSYPNQKVYEGDYVKWADHTWLVYKADVDDEIYTDGELRQCQYKLFWQNENGEIISRDAWVQNASSYSNGEEGNGTITLQSNQFMVYMPFDEDTEILNNGMRMNMCKSAKLCRPYKLTRPDDISYTYSEKGVLNIIFTQTQFNEATDKLVTLESGESVWICDYKEPEVTANEAHETTILSAKISGGKILKCGRAKTWTVSFYNNQGNETTGTVFRWNLKEDLGITTKLENNKITLKVEDDSLVGESFLLQVIVGNSVIAENEITITGLI